MLAMMAVSSRALSQWYAQLATSLEAGLSLERCIGTLNGPPAALRAALQARLVAGEPLGEALERSATWLPAVDRQLMTAAHASGRLPEILRRISARHEEVARATGLAVGAAIYPLILVHVAVLVLPLAALMRGDGSAAYASTVLRLLLPLWLMIALMVVAVRRRWRFATWLLDHLPFVGGFRRLRAVGDLAAVLQAQLAAGIRLDIAWLQAAMAAGDRRLEPLAIDVAEGVQRGEPVGPRLAGRRELPAPFADFYLGGEQAGRLDENLELLQRDFQRRSRARLHQAAIVYPALLFVGVGVAIAYQILSFWLEYFRQLEQFG